MKKTVFGQYKLVCASMALGLVVTLQLAAATDKPVKTVFLDQATTLPDKNFKTYVRSMRWPVGYKSKEHVHAGPGPRYVLSGRVEITEFGEARQYSAGEVFWHAGNIPHTAENVADEIAEVLIVELLPLKLR